MTKLLYVVLAFLVLAAIPGAVMLARVIKEKKANKLVAILHGGLAGGGMMILVIYISLTEDLTPVYLLTVLLAVALLGSTLLIRDFNGKPGKPKWLTLLHPVTALAAVGYLIYLITKI